MKTIILKTFEPMPVQMPDGKTISQPIDSDTLIRQCLNNVGEGVSIEEMRNRIKIFDKLDKLKATAGKEKNNLILEDTEYKTLKDAEAVIKWRFINQCFIDFHESIVDAK